MDTFCDSKIYPDSDLWYTRVMGIGTEILNLLNTPRFRYKGMKVNIFGLPIFKNYKKNSMYHALANLEKRNYIVFEGSHLKLAKDGKKYLKHRSARLQIFKSSFEKDAPKNLLIIFDIIETRKAEREWLRFQLRKFDYNMIQRSAWVGPSPLPKEFMDYLKAIKLMDSIKTFRLAKGYFEFKNKS